MRLKDDLVVVRETRAYERFRQVVEGVRPAVSEVQAELKSSKPLGAKRMALRRIYAIRQAAVDGTPIPPRETAAERKARREAAGGNGRRGRPPKPAGAKEARRRAPGKVREAA